MDWIGIDQTRIELDYYDDDDDDDLISSVTFSSIFSDTYSLLACIPTLLLQTYIHDLCLDIYRDEERRKSSSRSTMNTTRTVGSRQQRGRGTTFVCKQSHYY